MSFNATVKCYFLDLSTMEQAASPLGFTLVRGDEVTLVPYKTHEGGARALHKLTRTDRARGAHEIGVIRRDDGQPGYQLSYDPWGPGGKLVDDLAGRGLEHLKTSVNMEIAARDMARQGFRVSKATNPVTGRPQLVCHQA